jgi:hypothetical protein
MRDGVRGEARRDIWVFNHGDMGKVWFNINKNALK